MLYRFETESGQNARAKVEINSREHFTASQAVLVPYQVSSRWFSGNSQIKVLSQPWLLGSKLRALYQRKKGRDLYDLVVSLRYLNVQPAEIVHSFLAHLTANDQRISRAEMEENLAAKRSDKVFLADLSQLLSESESQFDFQEAFDYFGREIMPLIPGSPWSGVPQ